MLDTNKNGFASKAFEAVLLSLAAILVSAYIIIKLLKFIGVPPEAQVVVQASVPCTEITLITPYGSVIVDTVIHVHAIPEVNLRGENIYLNWDNYTVRKDRPIICP